jgi:cytoskeletal protein CcmA (bactofilin family)
MWGSRGKQKKSKQIDSLIGQDSEVKGDIVFTGWLHVDGTVRGNILSDNESGSTLTLSEQGFIEGEVHVPNVIINGRVSGDVYACEHVELAVNAKVKGNVYYKLIEMAMGAEVNGNLVHTEEPPQGKPALGHDKPKKNGKGKEEPAPLPESAHD